MVLEALEAARGDGDSCTLTDVEAQLAADGVVVSPNELTPFLTDLERSYELRMCVVR